MWTLAGSSVCGFADGSGSGAMFNAPRDVAVDSNGGLYVADYTNCRIRSSTWTGIGGGEIFLCACKSIFPYFTNSICLISLTNLCCLFDLNILAGLVGTLAGSGVCASTNGMGIDATFSSPVSVAVDVRGSVYVTESGSGNIRVIIAGVVSTLQMSFYPSVAFGLALDSSSNLYVTDSTANTISVFVPQGKLSSQQQQQQQSFPIYPSSLTDRFVLSIFSQN